MRLDPTDWAFLSYERAHPEVSAQIGQVMLFAGGAPSLDELRAHVGKRLHLLPRLLLTPPSGRPWLRRPSFGPAAPLDLTHHIRETRATRGLRAALDAALTTKLDHQRPLWELWLVHGYAPGEFALFYKVHHCLHDGVALNDVTCALLDGQPRPPRQPEPAGTKPAGTKPAGRARWLARAARGLASVGAGFTQPAARLPLDQPLSGKVRLVWCDVPLDELRRARQAVAGATLNDVYLAAVGGMLREWLLAGQDPPCDSFWVLVPVDTRAGGVAPLGNHLAAVRVPVSGAADPRQRLAQVVAATSRAKQRGESAGTEAMTRLARAQPAGTLRGLHELSFHPRLVNVMASNVAGPTTSLSLDGRPLMSVVAVNFMPARQPVSMVLMSYCDRVTVAFTCDPDVPSLTSLPDLWTGALTELAALPAGRAS